MYHGFSFIIVIAFFLFLFFFFDYCFWLFFLSFLLSPPRDRSHFSTIARNRAARSVRKETWERFDTEGCIVKDALRSPDIEVVSQPFESSVTKFDNVFLSTTRLRRPSGLIRARVI